MAEPWDSIRDHYCEVLECPSDVDGDTFRSSWVSGGVGKIVITERSPGQNDASLKIQNMMSTLIGDGTDGMTTGCSPDPNTTITTGRFDGTPDSVTTTVGDY